MNDLRKERANLLVQKNNNEKLIPTSLVADYLRRLTLMFDDNHFFLFDYLNGSGGELNKKFWSVISSSRYAFELYSWMAVDDGFRNIQFEYQLPTIKHSPAPCNMDVYFERKNTIYFIESKFTEEEQINFEDQLSIAYYQEKTFGNKYSLLERYYEKEIAEKVTKFIKAQIMASKEYNNIESFFYTKQEITHLVAIINYLRRNEDCLDNKKVRFYNVVYDFGDIDNNPASSFINQFKNAANDLVKELFPTINFVYDIKTINSFFSEELQVDLNKKKAFGLETTVAQQLKQFEIE